MGKIAPGSKEERILAVLRAGERDDELLAQNPGVLEPFRGQWVVTHEGRVIASSPDGGEAARQASAADYPGSHLRYVPTRDEREAVLVL
jgi:hypothetical protein